MLAELSVRLGVLVLGDRPPDGRMYWSARWWDRDAVEATPGLRNYTEGHRQIVAELIKKYGVADEPLTFLDVACGAGHSTELIARSTPGASIVAVDISASGLERATARLDGVNVRLIRADFWDSAVDALNARIVVCLSAVHHLGGIANVLARLRDLALPGGMVIGNVWTADEFHEFERYRYGVVGHARRSVGFLFASVLIRLSGGRLCSGAYRTQLLQAEKVEKILRVTFAEVAELKRLRYHIVFACRTVPVMDQEVP